MDDTSSLLEYHLLITSGAMVGRAFGGKRGNYAGLSEKRNEHGRGECR